MERKKFQNGVKTKYTQKYLVILILTLALALSGCGKSDETSQSVSYQDVSIEETKSEEPLSDLYSSKFEVEMECVVPDSLTEIAGGLEERYLGMNGAYYFKKHLIDGDDYSQSYDEILGCNSVGLVSSIIRDFEHQIMRAGYACDVDGYVGLAIEESEGKYLYNLAKYDSIGTQVGLIELPFLTSEEYKTGYEVASDIDGYWHIASRNMDNDREYYYVLSPDGELVFSTSSKGYYVPRFIVLPDGHIGCDIFVSQSINEPLTERKIGIYNSDTNEFNEISIPDALGTYAVNLTDGERIVYANYEGIVISDISLNNPVILYSWESNGIHFMNSEAVCLKDNEILVYYVTEERKHIYRKLTKATQELNVSEITLAVSAGDKRKYSEIVSDFNQANSTFRIVLKDDYDGNSLATQLIAGNGPVLLDTDLTGFEDKKNYFVPLKSIYDELGLTEYMSPAAVTLGSIDGEVYGVVTDCSIETAVTCRDDLSFDYESFIKSVESHSEIKTIASADYDEYSLAVWFLDHGIEDSYYIDKDENGYRVNEKNIINAIDFVEKYRPKADDNPENSVRAGEDACRAIYIAKPEELVIYKMVYGDNASFIGHPGKDGATNLLYSHSTLAVRASATKTEKDIAITFLKYLMSRDVQLKMSKHSDYGFSSRLDVLEQQINSIEKGQIVSLPYYGDIEIKEDVDKDYLRDMILSITENAVSSSLEMNDYKSILSEEFKAYFEGQISKEKVADNISHRVKIYLDEHS